MLKAKKLNIAMYLIELIYTACLVGPAIVDNWIMKCARSLKLNKLISSTKPAKNKAINHSQSDFYKKFPQHDSLQMLYDHPFCWHFICQGDSTLVVKPFSISISIRILVEDSLFPEYSNQSQEWAHYQTLSKLLIKADIKEVRPSCPFYGGKRSS